MSTTKKGAPPGGAAGGYFLHSLSEPLIYPSDDRVLQFLREGWFEYREQTVVSRLLRPGDCFVDVGAHCGLYSGIAQRRMNGEGTIIAVEPNPVLHSFLRKNAAGPLPVRLIAAAVSVRDGEAALHVESDALSAYATLDTSNASATADAITVTTRTLESLMPEAASTGFVFIKLDVEGVEGPVLKHAAGFLRSLPNIHLMVECDEANLSSTGHTTGDLIQILRKIGFDLFEIDENGTLSPFTRRDPLWGQNLIASRNPEALLARLRDVPPDVHAETQAFFERGKAAYRVYRRSEDLAKLLRSLSHLQVGLSRITRTLSGDDAEGTAIEARFASMGASENSDAIAHLLNDELGRIGGEADAVVERIKRQNDELDRLVWIINTPWWLRALRRLKRILVAATRPYIQPQSPS